MRRFLQAGALTLAITITSAAAAHAANPGWECIPTAAGKTVTSGGIGAAPKCGAKATPVLAPTYVSNGLGNKPTVQLSAVNLQIVNGSGSTSTLNGTGNVVIGYDTASTQDDRMGSHNLILGDGNGWLSYSGIVDGPNDYTTQPYSVALGINDTAEGEYSFVAGENSTASGEGATITGGFGNTATGKDSTVSGGASSSATGQYSSVSGGNQNDADGSFASVAGGIFNDATDANGAVLGGCNNTTGTGKNPWPTSECGAGSPGADNTATGGWGNLVDGGAASVDGGYHNTASGVDGAAIVGGDGNTSNGDASTQISGLNRLIGGHNGAQVGSTGFNP